MRRLSAEAEGTAPEAGNSGTQQLVTRLAFGSCTGYDFRPQPIWAGGVIPFQVSEARDVPNLPVAVCSASPHTAQPDAWVWAGDMIYMDMAVVDCQLNPSLPMCSCTSDWLHQAPYSCTAANVENAMGRIQSQVCQG